MKDLNIVFAGFGGQGILFAGKVVAYAGLIEGRELSWLPSYGPEMRGGLPEDDEMDKAWVLYNKPVLYGDPAPNYVKAYERTAELKPGDVFLVIGCSYHTAIACDLRDVAKHAGAKVIEIQEDAAHNVRKVLEELTRKN